MKLAIIGAALSLSACAQTAEKAAMWGTLDGKPPLVIAHRGASGYLPEHTLEAYALAVDQGADVIEPDLVFAKEGILVARHDRYLSGSTDVADHPEFASRKRANNDPDDAENRARVDWWIEDFTLAELKTLRARQAFPGRSKEFDGLYEIPTFDEMLALVSRKSKEAGRPVGVYPETKHPAFFASIGHDFEAPLLKALEGFDAGPVFIQSFEPEILKRLKGKSDAKLVQLVYEKAPGAGPNIPMNKIATYADGVGAAKDLISMQKYGEPSFIAAAHQKKLFVHSWTFRNDREEPGAVYNMRKLSACADYNFSTQECGSLLVSKRFYLVSPTEGFGDVSPKALEEMHHFFVFGSDGVFADFPDTAAKVRSKAAAGLKS